MPASSNKIILAGGSGFLGRTLSRWLRDHHNTVVVLSRRAKQSSSAAVRYWDGVNPGAWVDELEGARAVINLAGRSVDCRYTERNRREILESRFFSTRALGLAIAACANPPQVWLNSSTATIYEHTFGCAHDETGATGATPEAHDAFSIEVAKTWEREFQVAGTPATRKVLLRTAMVFGREPGGVFQVLRRMSRFGLGGKMAHGRQFVSWIHAADFCRAVEWLIENPRASGVYNICAPAPLRNRELMQSFRKNCRMPFGLPAPRWLLELGAFFLRTETELILKSRNVVPARLLREGFRFEYPQMADTLADLFCRDKFAQKFISRAPIN